MPDAAELAKLDEWELQLRSLRSEAEAARLDARAARLELLIRRMRRRLTGETPELWTASGQASKPGSEAANALPACQDLADTDDAPSVLKEFQGSGPAAHCVPDIVPPQITNERSPRRIDCERRLDAPHPGTGQLKPGRSHGRAVQDGEAKQTAGANHPPQSKLPIDESSLEPNASLKKRGNRSRQDDRPIPAHNLASRPPSINDHRRRQSVWVISLILHALGFALLTMVTFQTVRPAAQLTLDAAVADQDSTLLDSIEITPSTKAPQDPAEAIEESPVPVDMMTTDDLAPPPKPIEFQPQAWSPRDVALTNGRSPGMSLSNRMPRDSNQEMKFCGVSGGGKHFVFLVDSSGSMGDAFNPARGELIRSINALRSDQRFYVIFFDEHPDYMRLRSVDEDEPRSVFATEENKLALQRWAMTVSMDRGRAPYEALPFAIGLRPDAVFLLSDGEFPQRIEEILRKANHVENLFGDRRRISVVHTISYHSREGEQRMKRIAGDNGGQYRHVPEPNPNTERGQARPAIPSRMNQASGR